MKETRLIKVEKSVIEEPFFIDWDSIKLKLKKAEEARLLKQKKEEELLKRQEAERLKKEQERLRDERQAKIAKIFALGILSVIAVFLSILGIVQLIDALDRSARVNLSCNRAAVWYVDGKKQTTKNVETLQVKLSYSKHTVRAEVEGLPPCNQSIFVIKGKDSERSFSFIVHSCSEWLQLVDSESTLRNSTKESWGENKLNYVSDLSNYGLQDFVFEVYIEDDNFKLAFYTDDKNMVSLEKVGFSTSSYFHDYGFIHSTQPLNEDGARLVANDLDELNRKLSNRCRDIAQKQQELLERQMEEERVREQEIQEEQRRQEELRQQQLALQREVEAERQREEQLRTEKERRAQQEAKKRKAEEERKARERAERAKRTQQNNTQQAKKESNSNSRTAIYATRTTAMQKEEVPMEKQGWTKLADAKIGIDKDILGICFDMREFKYGVHTLHFSKMTGANNQRVFYEITIDNGDILTKGINKSAIKQNGNYAILSLRGYHTIENIFISKKKMHPELLNGVWIKYKD